MSGDIWTKTLYKRPLLRDAQDTDGSWDIQLPHVPHWAPVSSHSSVPVDKYSWARTASQAQSWTLMCKDE